MGWNEPYFGVGHEGHIEPSDAALMWAKFMMPLATETELTLVSPTSNRKKTQWTADFIKACYANRFDEVNPCDVDTIEKFAIHDYNCSEKHWRKFYDGTHE